VSSLKVAKLHRPSQYITRCNKQASTPTVDSVVSGSTYIMDVVINNTEFRITNIGKVTVKQNFYCLYC